MIPIDITNPEKIAYKAKSRANKYPKPHQSKREKARRIRQQEKLNGRA